MILAALWSGGSPTPTTASEAGTIRTGSPLLDVILQNATPLGLALVGVWLFLTNKVFPGSERERLLAKLEAVEAREQKLRDSIEEKFIPAMTRAIDVIEHQEEAMKDQRRDRDGGR